MRFLWFQTGRLPREQLIKVCRDVAGDARLVHAIRHLNKCQKVLVFLSDAWFEIGLTWCSASECSIHPLAGYSMKEGAWFAGKGTRAVEDTVSDISTSNRTKFCIAWSLILKLLDVHH
jgi:hypothetical protein